MKTFFVLALTLALVLVSNILQAAPFDTKMVQWTQPMESPSLPASGVMNSMVDGNR